VARMVQPRTYLLLACHASNEAVQLYQLSRCAQLGGPGVTYRYSIRTVSVYHRCQVHRANRVLCGFNLWYGCSMAGGGMTVAFQAVVWLWQWDGAALPAERVHTRRRGSSCVTRGANPTGWPHTTSGLRMGLCVTVKHTACIMGARV
jgi:hypothetical protein